VDADDAEFAATQRIGNRSHASGQAEAVSDSLVEPPPFDIKSRRSRTVSSTLPTSSPTVSVVTAS